MQDYLEEIIYINGTSYGAFKDESAAKFILGATNYITVVTDEGNDEKEDIIETRTTLALPVEILPVLETLYLEAKQGEWDDDFERYEYDLPSIKEAHKEFWEALFKYAKPTEYRSKESVFNLEDKVSQLDIKLIKDDLFPVYWQNGAVQSMYYLATTRFGDLQVVLLKYRGNKVLSLENYVYPIELVNYIIGGEK